MKKFYDLVYQRVVFLVVATVVFTSGVSIYSIQTNLLPKMKKLAYLNIDSKQEEISHFLLENEQSMRYLSGFLKSVPFDDEHEDMIFSILETFQENSDTSYESLGYITLDGTKHVLHSKPFHVEDRDYWQLLKTKETVVSEPLVSKSNHEKIVLIITRVYDDNHQLKGYVSSALTVSYLESVIDSLGVVHFNGRIENEKGDILLGNPPLQNSALEVTRKIGSQTDWVFVLEVPKNYLTKDIVKAIILIILCAIGILLISTIFIRRFTSSIEKPIQALDDAMKDAKNKKLAPLENTTSIAEFSSLNQSYNTMVQDIEDLIEKIKQTEQIKTQADHRALYASIKPHFLYNTLETISAMAYDHDDEEVEEAINNLATLFRIGLSDDRELIPLQDEIQHVKSYLAIQHLRYKDLFSYQFVVDDVDLTMSFMKFTIQPLVENAIYHGIKLLEHSSILSIHIYTKDDIVFVDVENEFDTIDVDKISYLNRLLEANQMPDHTDGYGLFNVNNRLKYHYGDAYGITLLVEEHKFFSRVKHPVTKVML